MLFFSLLSAMIVSLLVVELLVNVSVGAIFLVVVVLAVIWIIVKSYREWKLEQGSQREEVKPAPPQQHLEPVVFRAEARRRHARCGI